MLGTASRPGRPAGCRRRRRRGGQGLDPGFAQLVKADGTAPRPTVSASRSGPTGSRTAPEPVRAVVRVRPRPAARSCSTRPRPRTRAGRRARRDQGAHQDRAHVPDARRHRLLRRVSTASRVRPWSPPTTPPPNASLRRARQVRQRAGRRFRGRDVGRADLNGSRVKLLLRGSGFEALTGSRTPPTSSPTSATTSASSTSS